VPWLVRGSPSLSPPRPPRRYSDRPCHQVWGRIWGSCVMARWRGGPWIGGFLLVIGIRKGEMRLKTYHLHPLHLFLAVAGILRFHLLWFISMVLRVSLWRLLVSRYGALRLRRNNASSVCWPLFPMPSRRSRSGSRSRNRSESPERRVDLLKGASQSANPTSSREAMNLG